MPTSNTLRLSETGNGYSTQRLRLSPDQVSMIEEALTSLGEFGEVRLVVEKGRLRFLVTQKSIDVLKWTPGSLLPKESK